MKYKFMKNIIADRTNHEIIYLHVLVINYQKIQGGYENCLKKNTNSINLFLSQDVEMMLKCYRTPHI